MYYYSYIIYSILWNTVVFHTFEIEENTLVRRLQHKETFAIKQWDYDSQIFHQHENMAKIEQ